MRSASGFGFPCLLVCVLATSLADAAWTPGQCAGTDLVQASQCCLDNAADASERQSCFAQDFVASASEFTILNVGFDPRAAACGDQTCAVAIFTSGTTVQCLSGASTLGGPIFANGGQATSDQMDIASLGGDRYRVVFRDFDLNISAQDIDCSTQQIGSVWQVAPDGPNRLLPSINETTNGNVVIANVNGTTEEIEERLFDGVGNQIGLARLTPLLGLFADNSKSIVFNTNTDFPGAVHVVEDAVLGTITLGFGDFSTGNIVQLQGKLYSLEPIGNPSNTRLVGVTFVDPSGEPRQRFYDKDGNLLFDRGVASDIADDINGTGVSERTMISGFATFFGAQLVDRDAFIEVARLAASENIVIGQVQVFTNVQAPSSLVGADGSILLVAHVMTAEGGKVVGRYYPSAPIAVPVPLLSSPWLQAMLTAVLAALAFAAIVVSRRPV